MKQIPGFSNYSVTKDGRVWRGRNARIDGRVYKGLWLKWQTNSHGGHQYVVLYARGQRHLRAVHQLVLDVYLGPCPDGMECRHLDGDPTNNRLDNLKWGTHSENVQDAVRHGTHRSVNQSGEMNTSAKLSNQERRLIIYQCAIGLFAQKELAKEYGVHRRTIWDLITGKAWPFVDARKIREVAHV